MADSRPSWRRSAGRRPGARLALDRVHRAAARPRPSRSTRRPPRGSSARRQVPIIIDESDGDLEAFPRAIALGYRGVSTKNCKGIVKSFLNRTLVEGLNAERPAPARLFMSAEDLTNVPVVPLQQDLATVRALGIPHVERNGHHYVRGLAHCSAGSGRGGAAAPPRPLRRRRARGVAAHRGRPAARGLARHRRLRGGLRSRPGGDGAARALDV